jgi:hypothetical protein
MNAVSDWSAVAKIIEARMSELKVSTAALPRRTRLAEGTIRGVRKGRVKPTGATLGMLAVGLDWPADYLWRVAEGQPPAGPSPGTVTTDRLIRIERKLDASAGTCCRLPSAPSPAPTATAPEIRIKPKADRRQACQFK